MYRRAYLPDKIYIYKKLLFFKFYESTVDFKKNVTRGRVAVQLKLNFFNSKYMILNDEVLEHQIFVDKLKTDELRWLTTI